MKISFASISMIIDFNSEAEAELYKTKNYDKGWWFGEISKIDEKTWTMEVRKPYKDFNPGW